MSSVLPQTIQERIQERHRKQQQLASEDARARQERIANWKPPHVLEGDDVMWYATGSVDTQPYVAKVFRIRGNFVSIILPGGQQYESVRHVDDPAMVGNAVLREQGAWEHTPRYEAELGERKAIRDSLDAMMARIEKMEHVIFSEKMAKKDNK